MTAPDSPPPSRGFLRRRAQRDQQLEREVLAWWRQPGVLIFLGALALAAAGWVLLVQATRRIPVEEASVDGLNLRLVRATWILDQMDHGDNFQQPASMAPGMPESGLQRVTVHLAAHNDSDELREFRGEELVLVPDIGEEVLPFGAVAGQAQLEPGQNFNTAIHFDFDTTKPHGRLQLAWRREGHAAYFAVPAPAEHYHLRPRGGEVGLPSDARLLLPISNPERGGRLYADVYGCSACHGDPGTPDSNNIGPHLGLIGSAAGRRIAGVSAEQYIYDSILEPGAHIAPECQRGEPCEAPTAMPEYASLVTLQDAADLLGYLLDQGR
jgi:hypothetical protein